MFQAFILCVQFITFFKISPRWGNIATKLMTFHCSLLPIKPPEQRKVPFKFTYENLTQSSESVN